MAYRDEITGINADHLWRFDGDANDTIGFTTGTASSITYTTPALCEDSTNAAQSNDVGDRIAFPDASDINSSLSNKAVGGWLRLTEIQLPPKSIYREGTTTQQFNFVVWSGNILMLEIVDSSSVYQAFSNVALQPDRTYHIFGRVTGDGDFALYIDGVKQAITQPTDGLFGSSTFDSGTPIEFGDPSGSTEVGNAPVLLNCPVNGYWAFWCTFSNSDVPNDTTIREKLFEKGALPESTVTNQTQLDALADTVRGNTPLAIRVDVAGDLSLSADNVTFDPLCSIHVQYAGTGTLTWTNTNGSDASIGSTTDDGTITFVNPATLTTEPLITGSEVRYFIAGTTGEINGVESSSTSFSSSVDVSSVDVVIHAVDYVYIRVKNIDMTQGNVTLPVSQRIDRNYNNP